MVIQNYTSYSIKTNKLDKQHIKPIRDTIFRENRLLDDYG